VKFDSFVKMRLAQGILARPCLRLTSRDSPNRYRYRYRYRYRNIPREIRSRSRSRSRLRFRAGRKMLRCKNLTHPQRFHALKDPSTSSRAISMPVPKTARRPPAIASPSCLGRWMRRADPPLAGPSVLRHLALRLASRPPVSGLHEVSLSWPNQGSWQAWFWALSHACWTKRGARDARPRHARPSGAPCAATWFWPAY
jgi:hypothetical protein